MPKLSEKNQLAWPLRHAAVCLCDDLIEFASPAAHTILEAMLPALIDILSTSEIPTLLQAAAYGVAVCAQHGGAQVTPYVKPMLSCLFRSVTAADARTGEKENATDNAVSALLKIAEFRAGAPGVDVDTIMSGVVAYLPIKADGVEARQVHGQVVQAIASRESLS
jgi:importin-5